MHWTTFCFLAAIWTLCSGGFGADLGSDSLLAKY
jgi:hypothetical protein